MVYALSPETYVRSTVRTSVKILVVGPFAVGKTTLVTTLSEIRPLTTEEKMTEAGALVDDLAGVPEKRTTTVAMDFGRITLADDLVLYLFGTPGQQRFVQLWKDISRGALGALVLVDPRRLDASFDVMDLVEEAGLPYAVAVNQFDGAKRYPEHEIRQALDLLPHTRLVSCDVREPRSSAEALIALVDHLFSNVRREES
jgi:uncharacterized protein